MSDSGHEREKVKIDDISIPKQLHPEWSQHVTNSVMEFRQVHHGKIIESGRERSHLSNNFREQMVNNLLTRNHRTVRTAQYLRGTKPSNAETRCRVERQYTQLEIHNEFVVRRNQRSKWFGIYLQCRPL